MFRPDRVVLSFTPALAFVVIAVHLAAMLIVAVSVSPLVLQLLLLSGVFLQMGYLCWRYVWLRHPHAVVALRWTADSWFVQLCNGSEVEVRPTPACRIYRWITLLQFCALEPAGWRAPRFNLWLVANAQTAQAIRRLRVQLIQRDSSQS